MNGDIGNVTILNENSYIAMPKGTNLENFEDNEFTREEDSGIYKAV